MQKAYFLPPSAMLALALAASLLCNALFLFDCFVRFVAKWRNISISMSPNKRKAKEILLKF